MPPHRHSGEGRSALQQRSWSIHASYWRWIPAFAGMTTQFNLAIYQRETFFFSASPNLHSTRNARTALLLRHSIVRRRMPHCEEHKRRLRKLKLRSSNFTDRRDG
jgi:hypothetical protein